MSNFMTIAHASALIRFGGGAGCGISEAGLQEPLPHKQTRMTSPSISFPILADLRASGTLNLGGTGQVMLSKFAA